MVVVSERCSGGGVCTVVVLASHHDVGTSVDGDEGLEHWTPASDSTLRCSLSVARTLLSVAGDATTRLDIVLLDRGKLRTTLRGWWPVAHMWDIEFESPKQNLELSEERLVVLEPPEFCE